MFTPTKEQVDIAKGVGKGEDIKVIAGPGTGKAQPLNELILTPEGFKKLKDIHKGALVIGSKGTPIKVSNTILHDDLNMYELTFSDGTTTSCCEDHLWEVYDVNKHTITRNKTPKVLPLKELLYRINNPRTKKRRDGSTRITLYEYAVKLVQPVEFSTKTYKIPPYLMGYILGNGHSGKSALKVACHIKDFDEIVSKFPSKFILSTYTNTATNTKYFNTTLDIRYLYEEYYALNNKLSKDKFIPSEFLFGDIEQRKQLLAGLLDSDGSCVNNKLRYCSTSQRLIKDVQHLVQSLGGIAVLASPDNRNINTLYTLQIRTPFEPFLLSRKVEGYKLLWEDLKNNKRIVAAKYLGKFPGKCLEVEALDALYVTRDFTLTHNSSTLRYICQENKYNNFLSVTFNKANAVEADEHPDKPSNVEYKTSHGLAYREIIDFKMRKKLHYSMMYQEVPDTLASDIIVEYHRALEGSKKSTKDVQKEITELIRLFCNSDKASLTDFIESCSFEFLADTIEELICVEQALPAYAELAEEYWKLLIDKERPEKISHDVYLKLFQLRGCKIKGYDVILVDECLPGDSYVQTEKGNIKIRNLVTDYDLGIPVPLIKSYNILTDSFEYKPMVGSLISKNREVIEIRTEGLNKLRCTPNHKILTQRGYVEAGHLIVGEDLIFLDTPTNQKTKILLNSDQLQIVLGSCLGDGFLEKRSKSETYRCKLTQGEKQLEYLKWKAACLNLQVPDSPNVTSGYTGNKTVYSSFYTPTFALPKPLANCWEDFNTLGLAIWYMDDGSFESNRATIHCNTFTDTKAKFFQNLLKKNFSLDVSIHKNKEYNYFSFSVEETKKLFKLIHPFIHKDLAYKIDSPISSTRLLDNKFKNIGANFVSSVKLYSIETVYDITVEDNHNFITAATYYASGIIVHNCQDTNPCFAAILKNNTHLQQILVGDPAQSLYGFRGAKNCFSKFDYKTYYLSTSFRFSPEIAEYINKVQPYTDSPLIVIGAGKYKELKTTAYVARTNAGTFTIVAEQLKKNPTLRFYTPTDMKEIFSKLFHLQACFFNQEPQFPDKQLVHITNKITLEEAIKYSDDIARLHKLGEAIRQSFKTIGEANVLFKSQSVKDAKDADFIVSTIHKFKGLEADTVHICEDFINLKKKTDTEMEDYEDNSDGDFYNEEGDDLTDAEIVHLVKETLSKDKTLANLLYVAVSRPRIALKLPYYLQLFFKN